MAYLTLLAHFSIPVNSCYHKRHPFHNAISHLFKQCYIPLALQKAKLLFALLITLEILCILAEALSTAAVIYPNPFPLHAFDGFKEIFAIAASLISSCVFANNCNNA